MPIYIQLCSLVVPKEVLKTKYAGGVTQFKEDYSFDRSELHQEDDLLISIAYMNPDEVDIALLQKRGLTLLNTEQNSYSDDFTLVTRYGGLSWSNGIINSNSIYVWHYNTPKKQIELALSYSGKLMDEINLIIEKGGDPFPIIKSSSLKKRIFILIGLVSIAVACFFIGDYLLVYMDQFGDTGKGSSPLVVFLELIFFLFLYLIIYVVKYGPAIAVISGVLEGLNDIRIKR